MWSYVVHADAPTNDDHAQIIPGSA
jgi:hypothetical protein